MNGRACRAVARNVPWCNVNANDAVARYSVGGFCALERLRISLRYQVDLAVTRDCEGRTVYVRYRSDVYDKSDRLVVLCNRIATDAYVTDCIRTVNRCRLRCIRCITRNSNVVAVRVNYVLIRLR